MHADIVLSIEQDEDGDLIHIRKNRNGAAGMKIPVVIRGEISRFEFDNTR